MIEHSVADAIKKVAKGLVDRVNLTYVCPAIFEQVCEENDWKFILDGDYNGWEVDWRADIKLKDCTIGVSGSMLYGTASVYVLEWNT